MWSEEPVARLTYVHNGRLRAAVVGARGYRMDRVQWIERAGSRWLIGYTNAGSPDVAQVAHHNVQTWGLKKGGVQVNRDFQAPSWLDRV